MSFKDGCSEILKVAKSDLGRIYGRRGTNIKRIEAEYGVWLTVEKELLQVRIIGENKGIVRAALDYLKYLIKKDTPDFDNRNGYTLGRTENTSQQTNNLQNSHTDTTNTVAPVEDDAEQSVLKSESKKRFLSRTLLPKNFLADNIESINSVTQIIEIIQQDDYNEFNDKCERLRNFVKNLHSDYKIVIICNRRAVVQHLFVELTSDGFECQSYHSGRHEIEREQAVADLISRDINIFITTDMDCRSIDIGDITHIINFDFPHNIQEYIYRVYRTDCCIISYFLYEDRVLAQPLIDFLNKCDNEFPEALEAIAFCAKIEKERRMDELLKKENLLVERGYRLGN